MVNRRVLGNVFKRPGKSIFANSEESYFCQSRGVPIRRGPLFVNPDGS